MEKQRVLIIKLGAMGDVVQSFGAMRAIVDHHSDASVTCLTTPPFANLIFSSDIAHSVIALPRPKWFQLGTWMALRDGFSGFDVIYDLQNNDRTALYKRLFAGKAKWVGKATGYNAQADQSLHMFAVHTRNLQDAGVTVAGHDNLLWMAEQADVSVFNLPEKYALLVPGSAPQHPHKRWPHYAELAQELLKRGLNPVLIGGPSEENLLSDIAVSDARIINLCGLTDWGQIVKMAQAAQIAIGNDTGPMHFIGPTGCRTISLFSGRTSPARYHPLGDDVTCLQEEDIADIKVETVIEQLFN